MTAIVTITLQARAGETQRALDVRKGDVDDAGIKDHHQLRGGDDGQGQAKTTAGRAGPADGQLTWCRPAADAGSGGHFSLLTFC